MYVYIMYVDMHAYIHNNYTSNIYIPVRYCVDGHLLQNAFVTPLAPPLYKQYNLTLNTIHPFCSYFHVNVFQHVTRN